MRVTRRGYVVLCAFAILVMIIVCACLLSCFAKSEADGPDATPEATESAVSAAPTPMPTIAPTATPGQAPSGARMPTAEEEESAVDGIVRTSGVVLRNGPGQSFETVQKYDDSERVLIYAQESSYYLVQMLSDGQYGYMAAEFVIKFGLLPAETSATPVPAVPEGRIMGIVNVNEVALRTVPSTKNNTPVGVLTRGALLWVQSETDGFCSVEVAATGEKGYVYAKYIMTQAEVPVA